MYEISLNSSFRAHRCGLFLTLLFSLILVSCSGKHPRPDDALREVAGVAQALDGRANEVVDVRIAARADYYDNQANERVAGREVSISALKPASVRVSLKGFDTVLASLASDGQELSMLDTTNNIYYYGPATPENLSILIPLHLSGEDFVKVLTGGIPEGDLADDWRSKATLGWNEETGNYTLEATRSAGGRVVYELTYPDLFLADAKIFGPDGESLYHYQAKDFEEANGVPFPSVSRFTIPALDVEVTLVIESFEVNVEPNPRIFTIKPPRGAEKRPLGG